MYNPDVADDHRPRTMTSKFPGRLGVQQRVLPAYRVPFFEQLAQACEGGMSLFAGQPLAEEGILTASRLEQGHYVAAQNVHFFRGPLYLCYQRGLVTWLERFQPEVLIVEANPRLLSTPAAIRWMHARGRKVIGWGLGVSLLSGLPGGMERLRQNAWRAFLRQFDALIAYSWRGAEEYAALGVPRSRIVVAYNAVSLRPIERPSRPPIVLQEPPCVLFVGRLQARKRVDWLLRACALVEPPPRLIIVGDGPERAALERLARQVYPQAEFVGAKQGAALEPYFAQADLLVLPGSGGLAVHEAMAHGLPVVVARGDGTQDDLVRPANGWQIPPDDFSSLVQALRQALSDRRRLRQMGEESYRIVSQEINVEEMVAAFVRALNAVSGGEGRQMASG